MRPNCINIAILLPLLLAVLTSALGSRSMKTAQGTTAATAEPTNYDLIIIGSGLAGLGAAKRAKEKGIANLLVLDARDRVGGRTYSLPLNIQLPADAPVPPIIDLGAAWIHGVLSGSGVPNPMVALSRDAKVPTFNVQNVGASFDPQGDRDSATWLNTVDDMSSRFEAYYKRYLNGAVPKFKPADNDSLQKVVDNFIASQKKPLSALQQDALYQYLVTEITLEYAGDISQLSGPHYQDDLNWGGPDALPGRGYSALVDFLIKTANVSVRLNSVVEGIDYRQAATQGVVVVRGRSLAAGGGSFSFSAKAVINTMPLGYLQAQLSQVPASLFTPSLSTTQAAAIQSLGMGLLDKVILVWSSASWWSKVLTTPWVTVRNSDAAGVFSEFYNLAATAAKLPVIVCFNGGSPATAIEDLSDEVIVTRALDALGKVLPAGKTIPPPAQTIVTRWGKDPWTYGAYSYGKAGMKGGARTTAFAAVGGGRVRFAGEHTHEQYPATAHGAYLSGIREADAVAKLLVK